MNARFAWIHRSGWGSWLVGIMLWGLAAGPVAAQQQYFRNYTGDDGLSQLGVQVALQDRAGYLWIGTQAGLNRFDGYAFEVFGIRQGLASDWINALLEDASGRLWIGTNNGLSVFVPPDTFHTYAEAAGLPDKQVHALAFDAGQVLWIGTGDGLARMVEGAFEHVREVPGGRITALQLDARGRLWVGTPEGLFYREGGRFHRHRRLARAPVHRLAEDAHGRLWVGIGEQVVVLEAGEPVSVYTEADGLVGLPVRALQPGRDGTMWIGTIRGLAAIEAGRVRFIGPENGLPFGGVSALLEDHEGRLWVGGYGGFAKFVGRAFVNYRQEDGLAADNVRPIVRGPEGDLWVGTQRGLNRFDGRRWHTYTEADGLSSAFVRSLLVDHRGTLWIGTLRGLSYRDRTGFHVAEDFPSTGSVMALAEDQQRRLWVGVQRDGVYRRDPGGFTRVEVPGQSFSDARILVDRAGNVWISGDHGLSRWDGQAWRTFTVADGLAANEPYFMAEDPRGRLWFGYHASYGITVYDPARNTFRTYTTDDGLFHDAVYSVGVDAEGNIWIGTARGVDRFDGKTFVNYGPREGYASNESNAGGFLADTDGTLWFGTANGLSHYFPRYDLGYGDPPRILIRWLTLGEERFSPEEAVHVPYHRRDLQARVAALSFVNEKKLHLRYRLAGYDDTWRPLAGRDIRFTNLPPGRYTLEVQGRKDGSAWSVPATASFEIARPYWQTWWFTSLAALVLGLVGWGFYKYRVYQVEANNRMLARLVEERTAALQAQKAHLETTLDELTRVKEDLERANRELVEASRLKSEFLANMSHEIRTPMNGVIGMAELLLQTPLTPDQQEYVASINRCGEALLTIINDILDLSKIEAGKLELERVAFDLQEVIEDSVEFLAPRATAKGLELACYVQEEGTAVLGDPHRLRQVLTNLLGNAIKFTERGEVVVRAEVLSMNRRTVCWRIAVKDTGIGISPEGRARLFQSFSQVDGSTTRRYGGTGLGLAISRQLVEMMGGEIGVESEVGKGSTFAFTVRLRRQSEATEDGRTAGRLTGRRVLIVDDNATNRRILELQTKAWGMAPTLAASGPEALAILRAEAVEQHPFDLVILDHMMPEMNGLEVAARIKEDPRLAATRILLLTSYLDTEHQATARRIGIEATMNKPARQSYLFKKLVALVEGPDPEEMAPRGQGPATDKAPTPSRAEKGRILVVEDNVVNQKVAVHHLNRLGYRADVASHGREALTALARADYDLILMDIQMPEMDGFEATAHIREREPAGTRIPIVAMTANAMEGERQRCLESGMDDYIAKPFKQKELAQVLAHWIGQPAGVVPPDGTGRNPAGAPRRDAGTPEA
ncbi:MAG: histidine kinase [Rhodothermaceae bacterium]|nr:MAG: histidine kinase [Rhodothermaceae bacterium]